MTVTHEDFRHLFDRAFAHENYTVNGNRYRIEAEGRRLEVELGEQRVRKIALLKLPVTSVRFELSGYALCRLQGCKNQKKDLVQIQNP